MVVRVPKKVYEGLEAVRQSGLTNMLDYNVVMKIASDMDYHEAVVWLHDNKRAYGRGVFEGIEAEE